MKSQILFTILFVQISLVTAQVDHREHFINFFTFDLELSQILDGNVKGYQYAIGDESGVVYRNFSGVAKEAVDNNGVVSDWNHNSQMYVASVAKMVCTVAIMKMLENSNVPGAPTLGNKLNLFLEDYLPIRWRALIDGTEDDIRLKHLMRHHSGLAGVSSNAKTAIAGTVNVPIPDAFDYENANFELAGFMTVYMANAATMGALEAFHLNSTNAVYDAAFINTIQSLYHNFVQTNILGPAGISADCALYAGNTNSTDVYRYGGPVDNNGSVFGNGSSCMYVGWILSATDMINFMQQWSNPGSPGNILSQASVDFINDFPDNASTTPLGWIFDRDGYNGNIEGYSHNGIWWTCGANTTNCEVYTSGVMLLEDNMYLSINVNSNASGGNRVNRTRDLLTAYDAAVCSPLILLSNANKKIYHSAETTILTLAAGLHVEPNETVVLKAGTTSILGPGFHAKPGSKFRAYIADCSTLPKFN